MNWNQDGPFWALVVSAADPIVVIDATDSIFFANPAAAATFGYTSDELLKLPFSALVPERFRERHRTGMRRYLETGEHRVNWGGIELPALHSNGTEIPLEISFSEFVQNGQRFFTGIMRNIGERKSAHIEIERKARQQEVLAELGLFTLEQHDLQTLMELATQLVADALAVELCKVLKLLPDGKSLLLKSGLGWREGLIGSATVGAGANSQAGYTLLMDEPVIVEDLRSEKRFSGPPLLHEHGVISGVSVVIKTPDGPYGVMGAHTREKRIFAEDDTNFLQAVANVLAEGVRRQRAGEALLESERRYRSIFETAAVGVAQTSLEGTYLEVNERLCRELGYARDELLEMTFRDITTGDDLAETERQARRLVGGEIEYHQMDKRYVRKNGEVFWGHLTISAVRTPTGEPEYFTAVVENIDDRKRAETALEELTHTLERQVQERTERLREANEELESFNYSVSHDLRAPLRGIDGFSQALLEEYGGDLDETGKRYLERVRAAAQRMGELIDALLDLSRLIAGDPHKEEVDLSRLAKGIAEELQARNPERSITFVIHEEVHANGDPRLLRAALENLLENAWKFTREREHGRIEFGISRAASEFTYFVRDNGVGFDMQYGNKLFTAFQRLHSPRRFEGLGIGLTTVQRIIHRHGGKVWAESQPGEWTTFYFTLK